LSLLGLKIVGRYDATITQRRKLFELSEVCYIFSLRNVGLLQLPRLPDEFFYVCLQFNKL